MAGSRHTMARSCVEGALTLVPSDRRTTKASARGLPDRSTLAVTSVDPRRLEGETDKTWADLAAAIGV